MTKPSETALDLAFISGNLNTTMLENLLMGMYTMIYGGTMYLYISRNKPNRRIILPTITVLYLLTGIGAVLSWYSNKQIVDAGDTRFNMTSAIIEPTPVWINAVDKVVYFSGFVVSDALLIWRCYHVWGMSLRVIAFPSVLFLADSGLLVASIVVSVWASGPLTQSISDLYNNITTALFLVSLATTALTTFLIGYRIHKVARMSGSSRSKHRLNYITIIIAESAAMYAVTLLCIIILNFLSTAPLNLNILLALYYTQPLGNIVAGVSATILVARIAVKCDDAEQTVTLTTPHISEVAVPIDSSPIGDLALRGPNLSPSPSRLEKGDRIDRVGGGGTKDA